MPCAEIVAHTAALEGQTKLSAPQFKTPVQLETDSVIIREGCLSEQKFSKFAKRWVVLEKCKISGCIYLKIYRYSETGENPVPSNFKYQYILAEEEFIGCVKGKVGGSKSTAYSWAIIMKSDILQFQDRSRLVCEAWFSALREHIKYITWQIKIMSGLKSVGQEAIFFLTDYLLAVCHINVSKVMCVHRILDVSDVEAVDSHVKFTANGDGQSHVYEVETARASQAARVVAEISAKKEALLMKATDEHLDTTGQRPPETPPMINIRKESFLPVDTFPTPPSTPSKLSPYNISPVSSPNASPRLPRSSGASDIEAIDETDEKVEECSEESSRGKGRRLKKPGEYRWKRTNAIRRLRSRSKTAPETNIAQLIQGPDEQTPRVHRKPEEETPPIPARPAWTLKPRTRHLSMDQNEEKGHESSSLSHSLSAAMFSDLHRRLRAEKSVGCARCITLCTCKDKGYGPVLPERINVPSASTTKRSDSNTSVSSSSSLEDNAEDISSKSSHSCETNNHLTKKGSHENENSTKNVVGKRLLSRSSKISKSATSLEDDCLSGKNLSLPGFYLGDGMSLSPVSPRMSPRSQSSENYFFGEKKPPIPESSPAEWSPSISHSPKLAPCSFSKNQSSVGKKPPIPVPPRLPPSIPPRAGGSVDKETSQKRKPPIPSRSDSLLKSDAAEATRRISAPKPIPRRIRTAEPFPPPRSQSATQLSFIARECVVCKGICQCVHRASSSVEDYLESIEPHDCYLDMIGHVDHYIAPSKENPNYVTPDEWDDELGQEGIYLTPSGMEAKPSLPSGTRRKERSEPRARPCRENGMNCSEWRKKGELLRDDTYGIQGGFSSEASKKRQMAKSCGDIQRVAGQSEQMELCHGCEEAIEPSPVLNETRAKQPVGLPQAGFKSASPGKSVLFQLLFEYISRSTPPLDNLDIAPGVWAHFLIALDCENSGNALDDWRGLADFMGLSSKDMKLVDKQCRKSDRFASEFILLYWQTHRSPILPYTKENLFDVLTSLHRRDLVDILKDT